MKIVWRYVKIAVLFCFLSAIAWLSVSAEPTKDAKYIDEYITEALFLRLDEIDVLSFSCTESEIFTIIDRIVKTEPELYFVGKSFYYTVNESGYVKKITPVYIYSRAETKNIKAYCDREIEKILFSVDASMTDMEKALVLHEYMCEYFTYDESLKNHTMYELLRDGRGTCQALTLTYMELLSRVGIDSDYAYSNEIMHMWNVVLFDGEWYHVDITWDMQKDGVSHKNFLFSDSEAAKNGHVGAATGWGERCQDEKYSTFPLRESQYRYEYFAGGFVCVDNTARNVYFDMLDGGERIVLYHFDELWKKSEGRYYANSFSAPVNVGNKLYFNTKNRIMQIDRRLDVSLFMPLDFDMYGIEATVSGILCYLDRNGDGTCELALKGDFDADGDGSFTVLDIAVMSRYLYDGGVSICKYRADADGDRLLRVDDLDLMEKHILKLGD